MNEGANILSIDTGRLAWRETGDEVVVLDLQGSVYFGLNPTAARLWGSLARGATRADLVAQLVREQHIDHARATGDVDQFLAVLRLEGLVVTASD